MKNPIVSVIIPYYNKEKYIEATVQSVTNQSFENYEIIIVNDGSLTAIPESVKNKEDGNYLRIYNKKNEGVSLARNFGALKAKGEYLLFLDADDKISVDFLKETVEVLDNNENVVVVSTLVKLFGNRKGILELPKFELQLLLARNIFTITCLIRKSQFLKTDGFDGQLSIGFEDWDFWISYLTLGGDVFYLQNVYLEYRITPSSRNHVLKEEDFSQLRTFMFTKHRQLYANNMIYPFESFEYKLIEESREYKLGKLLLRPIRKILAVLRKIRFRVL